MEWRMTVEDATVDDGTAEDGTAEDGTASESARVQPRRIVMAKPGLDGHDRGAKVVARALRDAGHEVVYTGLHQTPEQIVQTALQEDADAIGLSVLSGAHMTLFAKVMSLLEANDARDIVVFGGGIIPVDDIDELRELGVAQIFTPGATTHEITAWVAEHVPDASSR
jgi:methylmalonyl-CoA mutase C-terminal domain/subunit